MRLGKRTRVGRMWRWSRAVMAAITAIALTTAFVPATAIAGELAQGSIADDALQAEMQDGVNQDAANQAGQASRANDAPLALMMSASSISADASLVAQADGTVDCGNGWVLEYADVEGGASITGVSKAGTGALVIPGEIGGAPVVAIGDRAFAECAELGDVTLPESMTNLGMMAFFRSGITSINIPAAVWRIPYRCFTLCTSLKSVNFQGQTMHYLSQQSFAYCSSLQRVELPLLIAYATREETTVDKLNYKAMTGVEISDGSFDYFSCIGQSCFENCSSLSEVVFRGPIVRSPKNYVQNTSCFAGCAKEFRAVCLGATVSIPRATATSAVLTATELYYTMDFYGSSEDAVNLRNRLGSVTYRTTNLSKNSNNQIEEEYLVRTIAAAYGTKDYSQYLYEGSADATVPACPEGKSWAIVDANSSTDTREAGAVTDSNAEMKGSFQVIAVDEQDVKYGLVVFPKTGQSGEGEDQEQADNSTIYMDDDGGISGINEIAAFATNGTRIDDANYKLVFEIARTKLSSNGVSTITEWEGIARENIKDAGGYRLHAEGLGAYEGSRTTEVEFKIVNPNPSAKVYYNSESRSKYLGSLVYDAMAKISSEEDYDKPAFNVLVPASDWRNQLLGAGFAGAGNGLLLTCCLNDYSNNMMQADMQSGTDSYIIIGTQEAVPQSSNVRDEKWLADLVAERTGTYGTRYGANATTAQELATAAITRFKPANWNAKWGGIALVASPSEELVTEAAAQYAYGKAARVFFLTDEGTIADADLTLLSAANISQIVIVGDEGCVSADVASKIAAKTGKTPTRILNGSKTAAAASLEFARQRVQAGECSFEKIVIADASDPANVSNAAVRAQAEDGVLLTCRSSADAKMIESFLEGLVKADGRFAVQGLYAVGSFAYLDGAYSVGEFFSMPWNKALDELVADGSYSVQAGDTFEVGGYVYEIADAANAELVAAHGSASFATAPASVTYAGVTYKVSAADPGPGPQPVTTQPMYRLYNPNSGEHFYTASVQERDDVKRAGWNDEGIGWNAPANDESVPVYRVYNAIGGEHHYTTDAAEKDMLVNAGWNYEGIGWYSDPARTVPLLREYNPNQFACNHNYTTDKAEHDFLVSIGWKDEGEAWYACSAGK